MRQLSFAIRNLRRDRGFTVTAILTLALGIGLSTAVFTVADALLLRDLPVRDQHSLITLWGVAPDGNQVKYPLDHAPAKEFVAGSRALSDGALYSYYGAWPTPIRDGDRITRLRQAMVSGNYFDVLGSTAVLGRPLRDEDDRIGARAVAVLSHDAWQGSYGGDADVIGRRILVHATGVSHEIVGVMPPGLDYPRGVDFWIPIVPASAKAGSSSVSAAVHVLGRLANGATASAARDELTAFYGRPETSVWMRAFRGVVTPLPQVILGDVRPAVVAFVVACALLLLISCINVGNLLLVRGLSRIREFAVRSAIGAHRRQIIGQLLVENGVLALAGGILGIVIASFAVSTFVAFAPASIPRLSEVRLDATALSASSRRCRPRG